MHLSIQYWNRAIVNEVTTDKNHSRRQSWIRTKLLFFSVVLQDCCCLHKATSINEEKSYTSSID